MKEDKNKNKAYIRLSSAGIQMGLVIAGAAWGGSLLDDKYQNETPIWTIVCSLLGVGAGLYLVIKEVINISKDDDERD